MHEETCRGPSKATGPGNFSGFSGFEGFIAHSLTKCPRPKESWDQRELHAEELRPLTCGFTWVVPAYSGHLLDFQGVGVGFSASGRLGGAYLGWGLVTIWNYGGGSAYMATPATCLNAPKVGDGPRHGEPD